MKVYTTEWVEWNEETMKFLNIEEDLYGRDLITFEFENKVYKSNILS